MLNASLSLTLYLISALVRLLLANAIMHNSVLSGTLVHANHKLPFACRSPEPSTTTNAFVSKYGDSF